MNITKGMLYTKEHIWIKKEDGKVKLGITEYFKVEIGEVLLVELPEKGRKIKKGDNFALVETAKAVLDLKSPVSGSVIEINPILEERPETIKDDPYERGWMAVFKLAADEEQDNLMSFEEYKTYLQEKGII